MAALVVWASAGRPWSELGLGAARPWPTAIALLGVIGIALVFWHQVRTIRHSPEARALMQAQSGTVGEFLPHSPREGRWFMGVSLSAGIGEELFYRAFLVWYLGESMGGWAAIGAANAAFAVAHLMHGSAATFRAAGLGLVFSVIYSWTGSIYPAMVLHTLIDVFAGQAWLAGRDSSVGNGSVGADGFGEV